MIFSLPVRKAFANELFKDYSQENAEPVSRSREEARANNRKRSIAIFSNGKVRQDHYLKTGAFPTEAEEKEMLDKGLLQKIPPMLRPEHGRDAIRHGIETRLGRAFSKAERSLWHHEQLDELKVHLTNRLRSDAVAKSKPLEARMSAKQRRLHRRQINENPEFEFRLPLDEYTPPPPPVTEAMMDQLKSRMLRNRTEAEWVQMIERIEDDDLRLAVSKKVWWDFFSVNRWSGLNHLIFEDEAAGRWIVHFNRNNAPEVEDLRIALWTLGYPISIIRTQYNADFESRFTARLKGPYVVQSRQND